MKSTRRVFLLTPLACACSLALAQGAALPTGGTIVRGSGSISSSGSTMTVRQTTDRLVADWQSFSIGAGNTVRFVQPGRNSVALNRIVGDDASVIYGNLTANGHVFLQNTNGVLFAPGSQVSVGALVATTLKADVDALMAGQLRLSGDSSAAVRNAGTLRAAEGGHVVLAGRRVGNSGSIVAPGGTAALAAGSAVEIDPTGSGLLSIRVPVEAVAARVANSGRIVADGGQVSLQVAAAEAALGTVMQVGGVVRARSIEQRDGRIVLSGGDAGVVRVTGTLDARGGAGLEGGSVEVTGQRIGLLGAARIDASGAAGGGTVLVGGGLRGEGPQPHAQVTAVGAHASIDVSARVQGDGGTAVVWSDALTRFEGHIAARGAGGGNGGLAEVSGKQHLSFLGSADLRAPGAQRGTLLLDPSTLQIGATADINGDNTVGDDLVASSLTLADFAGAASRITSTRVATLLATTDVDLAADFQISVTAPLTVAAGGAATTLTLTSPTLTISSPMTLNNSSLALNTGGGFSDSIAIGAPIQSLGSVSLTASSSFISNVITAQQVNFNSPQDVSASVFEDAQAGGIVAAQVTAQAFGDAAITLNLQSPNNRIGSLTLDTAGVTLRNDNPAGTPMSVQGSVGGDFTLSATGGLTQSGALTVSGVTNITTTGTDAALLTNAGNQFLGAVGFAAGGDFELAAQGPLIISGRGAGDVRASSTGVLTLDTAGINTTGALIDLTTAGFVNATDTGAALQTGAGGRFIVRSTDPAQDNLGTSLAFGTAATDFNGIVYGDWTGALPTTGNLFVTSATGTIDTPATDWVATTRTYDGTTGFAYAFGGTTATGLFGEGSFSLSNYTVDTSGSFADKNAGASKAYTVAASGNTSGTDLGGVAHYGLQFAGFTDATAGAPAFTIDPRTITGSGITAVDRVYDATTQVALSAAGATLANTVTGDAVTLSLAGATGTMADKNVGAGKAVTVANAGLAGADAGNYVLASVNSPTVTITPRPITADGVTGVDRVYDGGTQVALSTSAATLTGLLGSDVVTLGAGTGNMADKNVGTAKPVTGGIVSVGGADAGNYTVTVGGTPTVTITPRGITSNGITAVDRAYDGTTAVALNGSAATLNNTVSGDDVTLSLAGASGTMSDKNVGTAKPVTVAGLALGGADAANYTLTDASAPTVNISALTLTLSGLRAVNRVVNGSTQVRLVTDDLQLSGLLPSDAVAVDASGAVGNVSSPDPGLGKPVTVSGITLTGADAANYNVSPLALDSSGQGLTVRILTVAQGAFEDVRYTRYLQGLSDAQEPFRRAMAEALAAGFGKENIRKQLSRGLVFETGLAAPAVDNIDSAKRPDACAGGGAGLGCR
ncbi:beta strand repeat-containing protein [Piscinibacter defluvii]|uniref:beta strand repeat-containing protein n=1 Tax=Piscinibacter defluvii TaxID=1796922 RepID=UPI000FDF12B9|nr:YDG domain-containing protein [Piscinibacter defluvii]